MLALRRKADWQSHNRQAKFLDELTSIVLNDLRPKLGLRVPRQTKGREREQCARHKLDDRESFTTFKCFNTLCSSQEASLVECELHKILVRFSSQNSCLACLLARRANKLCTSLAGEPLRRHVVE